jgi:hypothetical protein
VVAGLLRFRRTDTRDPNVFDRADELDVTRKPNLYPDFRQGVHYCLGANLAWLLVRTDRHNHRLIAGDSADAEAIKVLARTHQSLIWARNRQTNTLRIALREYYSAALEALEDLAHGDALGRSSPLMAGF